MNYWANATSETWAHEMGGMRDLLSRWANIPEEQIYGSRSPLLKLGGNRQMAALDNEESVEIKNLFGLYIIVMFFSYFINPIPLVWVPIWHPLPFYLYLRHEFCSESEEFEGNRVKRVLQPCK